MNPETAKLPLHLELVPATADQEPILANLFELYAYDFSEFQDVELASDGHFGYRELPLYWVKPGHRPFLVRLNGKLAGFVLIKQTMQRKGADFVWDVAEFFIIRGCRRRGIGTEIAHKVWRLLPGPWEVRVMQSNRAAKTFWEHAIMEFVGAAVDSCQSERDGQTWNTFSFDSAQAKGCI